MASPASGRQDGGVPRIEKRRVINAVVVAGALGLIGYGLVNGATGEKAITKPAGVERFVPNPGDLVLRQGQIGIDLANGYRGSLVIDDQPIPTYDLAPSAATCSPTTKPFTGGDSVFDPAQSTVYFQPGPNSTIEKFAPGLHRVTARFWKLCDDPDTAETVSWTFNVS